MRFDGILVAVDFSKQSLIALDRARALLRRKGTLHLATVIDPKGLGPKGDKERKKKVAHGKAELIRLAEKVVPEAELPNVQFHVGVGRPAETLAATAKKARVDLLVVGSHARGRVSRVVLGSVAEELARISEVPVLVVRELAEGEGAAERVLIAVDDTSPARLAARAGVALAEALGARVEAVRVIELDKDLIAKKGADGAAFPDDDVPASVVESIGAALDAASIKLLGPKARVRYATGEPGPAIAALATPKDVVVCGTHGRSGLGRLAFGSVATKLIRSVPCPILVVRPHH